jgi:CO/xanthine dehydrogenase Mo-binding subunit
VRLDSRGRVTTRALREYHVPVLADVPPSEVLFAGTFDPFGPYGAKPMSEAPFNPVAPALANAVRDATGVRLTALPLRRDRVYEELNAQPSDPRRSDPQASSPAPSAPPPVPPNKEE